MCIHTFLPKVTAAEMPDKASNDMANLNLMRLTSPSLPIGAYAYSQGLEFACDQGWVHDRVSARDWIGGLLRNTQACLDVPVLGRLFDAWSVCSTGKVEYWSRFLLACRESSELRSEDRHLGNALFRLLVDLKIWQGEEIVNVPWATYAAAFSLAAVQWHVSKTDTCIGYLWAWCENQVSAAVKLVPLGQTDGQRLASSLIHEIPTLVRTGLELGDDEIAGTAVGLGIASANHELQYSRLFRS